MITVYGIKNCDTCRKALAWLSSENIDHVFHDFRKDGLDSETVSAWIDAIDLEILINRRGTTYRNLPEEQRIFNKDSDTAELLCTQPTLMKRPIFALQGEFLVGFKPDILSRLKNSSA